MGDGCGGHAPEWRFGQRPELSDALALELQVVAIYLSWVLGINSEQEQWLLSEAELSLSSPSCSLEQTRILISEETQSQDVLETTQG